LGVCPWFAVRLWGTKTFSVELVGNIKAPHTPST